jgi:hypothetical protein
METKELIEELYACSAECITCYNACQQEENKEEMERCMKLDQECADICELSASLLERNSPNGNKFILLCSEICDLCAEECEQHKMDHCRRCAEKCRKCAKLCRDSVPGFLL